METINRAMTPGRILQLTNSLLEIIDEADQMTRSDLQGAVEAWVMNHCK